MAGWDVPSKRNNQGEGWLAIDGVARGCKLQHSASYLEGRMFFFLSADYHEGEYYDEEYVENDDDNVENDLGIDNKMETVTRNNKVWRNQKKVNPF